VVHPVAGHRDRRDRIRPAHDLGAVVHARDADLYVRAWRLEPLGVRGNVWGLVWLAMWVAFWSLQPAIVELFDGVVALAVSLALSTLLWLWTPWLLVAKRIAWQRLLPQAFLTAVGVGAFAIGAAIYLPRAIASASGQFGILGVAFTLLSLLFALALVLVVAAALGATLAESPGLGDALRRRGHDDGRRRPTGEEHR
jgi:membrane protein